MVARSNLACFALFFLSTVLITHSMSEARLCRDPLCNEPISVARVITNFEGTGEKGLLELKVGEKIYIYAKEPDETPELWYGESNGKGGFFPKEHVEELIIYEPKPAYVVSKDILENSEDPGGADNKENKPNDQKTPENASESTKEEENKDKEGENDKSKGTEGTMSGIIGTISDFFSVPVGEEADESTLSSEQNTEIVTNNEEIIRNGSDNMQNSLQGEKGDKVEKIVGDNLESKFNDKIENGGNGLENKEEKKDENDEQTQLSGQNKEDASRHSSTIEQQQEEQIQGKDNVKGEGSTSKSASELEEQQQKQAQQDESRKHAEIGNEDNLHHKVQAPERNQEKQNVLQEDKESEKSREHAGVPVQNHEENKDHNKEDGQSQDQQNGGLNPENKKQNKIEEDIEKRNHDLSPESGNEINKESKPEIQREGESVQEKDENKEPQDKHQSIDNQQPGNPHQTDNTPNGQEERKGQKLTEQASKELDSQEHDKSEVEDNVEDALSKSMDENKEKREETQGEEQNTANEEPNVMEQNSAEAVNPSGEKKLPQFIPGEYMSLPREELMKVLEERQKFLNAQQKEEESKDNGDVRKVFKPAVLNPDGDDQSKSQDLSSDGNQEGKKSMDEMVKSVQEDLKAVVEEDLSRLGKANDVKREGKKMEFNNEFSPEDGQGIRDVSKDPSEEKKIQGDGEVENENKIQSDSNGDIKVKTDVSSDEKVQEDQAGSASPERKQRPFSFKGTEILLQRRKLREKAEQEHHERTHGGNGEGNSDTEKLSSDGSVKQESANEERHEEEKPESKKEVVDEKTNKGIEKNDAKKVDVVADASNEGKPDDSSEQDETEDEEEEDYEEVAPLKVGHQSEALKQEPENESVKEKKDKVEPSSSQGDTAGVNKNVQVEAVVKTKEEIAKSEDEKSKAEKEMENKETIKLDDEEKKESLTKAEREEKEDVTNDEAQKNKEKEEEIKRQKEEEERQVRLHLLQEERKRVQALDEQAKILLQRKKEYEKKLEEDRLRKDKEKLKEEEERKERIKLEVEKRLKAMEEEKKKKEEEERRRELEEERKIVEEETKRIENEMKRKEEENKRIEEEMKRMEEEQKKKSEDDDKKRVKEEADKLREEMEIEAALKNRLKDLAKNEKVKPKEENLEGAGKMSSERDTKSIKEKLSSGKERVQGESLIKNKFKKMKMKVGIQKNKNVGRNRKAKKMKAKKKRKFYDMNVHYDEDDYEDDGKEDFLAEFDEIPQEKRKNKGKRGMNRIKKQPNNVPEEAVLKKPTSENEPKAAAETVRKPDATKTETTLGSQDTTVVNTATSLANPIPSTQVTTQTTQTTTQATQTMTQATQVSDTTATSVINPTASTQVPAQATTSVAEDIKIVDAVQVPKPPVNNDTDVQQRPNTDTEPPAGEGARMILPNQDKPDIENLQPKVTYSEDKSFDRRVPPKEPPTLPTVIQTPLNEKEIPSDEVKTEPVPKETPPPETPAKDLPDAINQPTAAPTSAAETVVPMVTDNENITKKAEWKSYGILKGFWRFHELLAEKIIQFGQPLKGAVRGVLAFVGLGQVFDDICRDLASAPPFVIVSTIVFGAFGVVFLFWSCIVSFSPSDAAKGPSPRDILKTYEARIRILEEELGGVEKSHKELQLKSAHAIEEKHHSDEAANTARKSLEQSMIKIKQNESEMHHLQEIINANKQEIQATSEEIEQKDEEIEQMQQLADNYKGQIQSKEEEIQQLKEKIHEFEKIKGAMDEEIEVLKDRLDGFEEEKTSLDKEIKDWNNKYDELQRSLDDQELRNRQIKEQYDFKCTEVEVLQGCLLQIKGKEDEEDEDEDELLSEEERDKIRSERLQAMLDASKSKAEAKIMKEENMKYKTELEETKTAKEVLEEKIQDLEHNLSEAKLNEEKAYLDFREKEIELAALRKYFKDTESELHRKLTAEESAREATESKLRTELSKANNDSRDLMTYKKLYADINEEIQRVKGNVGHQVAAVEERAHNNWLKYRTVERELEEVKRERDALRRRMYALEKEKNRPGSSASGKSSDSADGVRAESPIRGPPPPGHPAAPRVPDRNSPVPMAPPMHHPMYGPPPPVIPLGYGPPPPPPPGRFGPPPPPPQGYMGTPPPARNGPPPPPTGRTVSGSNTLTPDEQDERERRNSRGYGTDDPRDSRRSGHRSVSPPNGPRNHVESPSNFSRPPVSSSTPGDPRHAKLGKIQNSLDNDRDSLQNDYDSRPNDAPPPYVPHPPGPTMSNSPMMRRPMRPPYGPPMGPSPMGSPMRPPYGPARASPMGSPMGPPRPPPPGQSPVPGPPPMGPASGPNAYRRMSGNRLPTNSSTS